MSKQKVAIYTRVSTHHQVDKDSLEFQEKELKNYSEYLLGIKDYEVFSDAGYSGKNTKRPGYQEMMNRIEGGEFTHLLVWKIDRISRNLIDFAQMYEDLKGYDVTFVSKNEQFDTSSAMGEAMLKIILVFAELERNLASERVTSIMLDRAQKGLWNGAPTPLGYNYDKETQKLTINKKESEHIKFIFDQYEEHHSTGDVKHQLEIADIKTKRGGSWTTKTIGQILRNPIYKGTYRYNYKKAGRGEIKDKEEWIIVDDCFPAIIDEDQWEKVNKMLDENYAGQVSNRRRAKNVHVFSGIIECPHCDINYIASPGTARKDGFKPSIYKCRNYSVSKAEYSDCPTNNFISEVNLGPFILNYISNLVKVQQLIINQRISKDKAEELLIQERYFKEVVGIESKGLTTTYNAIYNNGSEELFKKPQNNNKVTDLQLKQLKKKKEKQEKALSRLEDLYLYSEEAMAKKDYLIKQKQIKDKIKNINSKISERHSNISGSQSIVNFEFIKKASRFLISQELIDQQTINYRKLISNIDKQLIKDFVQSVVRKLVIDEKKVLELEFINGLKHKFIWEDGAKGLKGRM
ncbi:recombinase family protein [Selenihalanaerobacter shriftii]|uniref:Site-specific DNA recombinase n=1 Tax=Selenihalanaerobacter shriftii TaxID=142842 RepID=A0A1T4Q7H4_9FIRM|nr:recombinase family protein [Selenihalanaerobacter shriftii]SJZ99723.1 Site-specific DNA recombinase [Selenihalanaerobacter shriftii]